MKLSKTFTAQTRMQWRKWLAENHGSESEVWLVFHKVHTGRTCIAYEDAVEEALCFGWIDSIVRRLDDARYARKFTPRKPDSQWSTINRRRYAALQARGLLAAPGLLRAPTACSPSGDAPRPSQELPRYIKHALDADTAARNHFEKLPPSQRRMFIGWIDSAKKHETKAKRLQEAVDLLRAGKKLGLK